MVQGLLLHSVSYSGSWGQAALSLDAFIAKAAALGFDGVEIMAKRPHFSLLDYGEDEIARLRDHLGANGVKHAVIAAYTNFTADLEHAEVPHAEMQIHYVTELARAAAALGASSIRVFTAYEHPAAPYQRQWNTVVNALRETARRAADHGVVIGVQNHHDIAADFESLDCLLREVDHPNCRAMFDAWAPALHDADIAAGARLLASKTVHTTVANYRLLPRFRYVPDLVNYERKQDRAAAVSMQEGFIDYRAFFDALLGAGFTGTVAYEMCSPLAGGGNEANLDRHARSFLDYMRAYMPEHERAAAVKNA